MAMKAAQEESLQCSYYAFCLKSQLQYSTRQTHHPFQPDYVVIAASGGQ